MSPTTKKKFVVVTTEKKGVFGGYLNGGQDASSKTVVITEAQMCVWWPAEVKGMPGLAVTGPLPGSRVSPAAPKVTLQDVTAVWECTEAAEKAWRDRPWR